MIVFQLIVRYRYLAVLSDSADSERLGEGRFVVDRQKSVLVDSVITDVVTVDANVVKVCKSADIDSDVGLCSLLGGYVLSFFLIFADWIIAY